MCFWLEFQYGWCEWSAADCGCCFSILRHKNSSYFVAWEIIQCRNGNVFPIASVPSLKLWNLKLFQKPLSKGINVRAMRALDSLASGNPFLYLVYILCMSLYMFLYMEVLDAWTCAQWTESDNMCTWCFKKPKNDSAEIPPGPPEDPQNHQVGLPGPSKSPTGLKHVREMLQGSKKDSAEFPPGTPQGHPKSPSWLQCAFP